MYVCVEHYTKVRLRFDQFIKPFLKDAIKPFLGLEPGKDIYISFKPYYNKWDTSQNMQFILENYIYKGAPKN